MVHKRVLIHPPSRNNYLGVIVNLLINTRPLKTAQLPCICFLCSWLTGHFWTLSHRSGTNRQRQGCRFNIVRSRQCFWVTNAPTMTVHSYFCLSWLTVCKRCCKVQDEPFPPAGVQKFPSIQLRLIQLLVVVTSEFFWNLQDKIKASAKIAKRLHLKH